MTGSIQGHHHPAGEVEQWADDALRFHLSHGAHHADLADETGSPADLSGNTREQLDTLHGQQDHHDADPYAAQE